MKASLPGQRAAFANCSAELVAGSAGMTVAPAFDGVAAAGALGVVLPAAGTGGAFDAGGSGTLLQAASVRQSAASCQWLRIWIMVSDIA
jgi:hypothetical protein